MNTKGNIGQVVYIPVTISEIKITKQGIWYTCALPKDGISQTYDELEIQFAEDNIQKVEEKSQKVKKAPDQKQKLKRGRPRKATVEDLLNTVKSKSKADIPNSAKDALSEELRERGIM